MWKDAQIMLREKVCKIAHKKMIFFKGESYVYVVTHIHIHIHVYTQFPKVTRYLLMGSRKIWNVVGRVTYFSLTFFCAMRILQLKHVVLL